MQSNHTNYQENQNNANLKSEKAYKTKIKDKVMNSEKLLNTLVKENISDSDALGMIFSNYIDIGGSMVGLTVKSAIKAAILLREYDKIKRERI